MTNEYEFDYFRIMLKVWRKQKALTLGELSELTQIHVTRLGVIEAGGGTPTMGEFIQLCDWMNENPCTFFKSPKKAIHDGN